MPCIGLHGECGYFQITLLLLVLMPIFFYSDFSNNKWHSVVCNVFLVFLSLFHYGVLGKVWYLLASISDLCFLPYFHSKIYDKQNDLDFELVNFPFLAGDVPRSPSYVVFLFCDSEFNNKNKCLTAKVRNTARTRN